MLPRQSWYKYPNITGLRLWSLWNASRKKMHEMKKTPLKEKNYNIFESKRETDGLKQRISDERKSLREF